MLWGSVVQRKENKMTWAGKQAASRWPVFLSLDIFSTSFVPMKVHLASSKWLYLSVSAALSLCCLPNPIARSAHMCCCYVLVTLTCILHMTKSLQLAFINCFSFIFHTYQLGDRSRSVCHLFSRYILTNSLLLGKFGIVSWVIDIFFLFRGLLLWFSSI